MNPEAAFLAAGVVAIAGGAAQERAWPKTGYRAVVATAILVLVASATSRTPLAPLMRAFGIVVLMAAVYGATLSITKGKAKT